MKELKKYNLNRLLAKCYRCDYEWIPRVEDIKTCAKCRSPYWDKAKDPKHYFKMQVYASHLIKKSKDAGLLGVPENQKCVDCGKQAKCWEHRNYARPLLVVPVCNKCNCHRGMSKNYDKKNWDKYSISQRKERIKYLKIMGTEHLYLKKECIRLEELEKNRFSKHEKK